MLLSIKMKRKISRRTFLSYFYYDFETLKLVLDPFMVIEKLQYHKVSFATWQTFKRTKNLKLIILGCSVTAIGWKIKKVLQLGPVLWIKLK